MKNLKPGADVIRNMRDGMATEMIKSAEQYLMCKNVNVHNLLWFYF
jgi:hypothetical protein